MPESDFGTLLAERARRRPRSERRCPEPEALAALALDRLPPWERAAPVAHLEICPDCATELAVASQAGALIADTAFALRSRPARLPAARRWLSMAAALVLMAGGAAVYQLTRPEPASLRGVEASPWVVTPADGARLAKPPHEFVWPEVVDARGYEVELFDGAFTRLARSGELVSPRYELPGGVELRRGEIYFWRVTVGDSTGEASVRMFSFRLEP